MSTEHLIALNRSEHLYWAGEGHLGPISQPYLLRFNCAVDEQEVRRTLRELTSAYPRMRGVLEPGWFTHRLRILDDDALVDQLFEDAYRVVDTGVDASSRDSLGQFHNRFLNESISLERGLPWRARFVPHGQQAALFFSVHHIIGDGRSMMQMLCAILARLNGHAIAPCQLESSSMLPAVTPAHWWQWPKSVARCWRNFRHDRALAKAQHVVTLVKQRSPRFGTSSIRYQDLPGSAAQVRAVAKAAGTTVNTLMMALVAQAFLEYAPDDPQAVAAMQNSVDLRRFFPDGKGPEFGNFVAAFTVRATRQANLQAQVRSMELQAQDHLQRFERRERALPLSFYELLPIIGRTAYSHLIVNAKRKGKLPQVSCHLTNLGSLEFVNAKDARVRLQEFWPATISGTFILGIYSLNGRMYLPVVFPNDEVQAQAVERFVAILQGLLAQMLSQAEPSASPAAA